MSVEIAGIGFPDVLVTTGAVVPEALDFLSDAVEGPESFASLLISANVEIVNAFAAPRLTAAVALMAEYRDTPMDFADATRVNAATQLALPDVVTLDRRGFSTYRTRKGKAFRLVLDRYWT